MVSAQPRLEQVSPVELEKVPRLALWIKLVYGSGEWSYASYGTLRQIFYAIFLTDVVGLDARLASIAALLGTIWDAINDPLVGAISDNLKTRWGRRRPFLLFFSIPFALSFLLLWWAPPWSSQIALMITVMLAFMISDTMQTLVSVPYVSLTPEITPDYDERTSLASYRMFFNLLASLITAVSAPMIVKTALRAGLTQQQGYLMVSALFGGLAALPFLLIFFVIRERFAQRIRVVEPVSIRRTIEALWSNIPFRFAVAIYMLNWIIFDLVAMVLPFFLLYWVAQGDLLASINLFGEKIALESVVLGLLLITAVVALPIWTWLSHRFSKREAYFLAMSAWAVVQAFVLVVQPGQMGLIIALAVLSGLCVSAAHALPDAIFPDVIEWDELRTRRRREGIYYGIKNFVRKLAGALAIFFALQVLGWFGYQSPPKGAIQFQQSPTALTAIRMLIGPVGTCLLGTVAVVTWFYPLTRERHARVLRLLARRRQRQA